MVMLCLCCMYFLVCVHMHIDARGQFKCLFFLNHSLPYCHLLVKRLEFFEEINDPTDLRH